MRTGTIAFLVGILLFNQLSVLPEANLRYLFLVCLCLLYFRPVRLLVFLGAGFFWMHWHASLLLAQTLPNFLEGMDVVVGGEIISIPQQHERRTRFEFDVTHLNYHNKSIPFSGDVRLSWYGAHPVLNVGESIVVPFLRQSGIQVIDKLIVSHGDNDHAGGSRAILSMMPVE